MDARSCRHPALRNVQLQAADAVNAERKREITSMTSMVVISLVNLRLWAHGPRLLPGESGQTAVCTGKGRGLSVKIGGASPYEHGVTVGMHDGQSYRCTLHVGTHPLWIRGQRPSHTWRWESS